MDADIDNLKFQFEPDSDFFMQKARRGMTDPTQINFLELSQFGQDFQTQHYRYDGTFCDDSTSGGAIDVYNKRNAIRDIEDYYHGSQQTKNYEDHSSSCRCLNCAKKNANKPVIPSEDAQDHMYEERHTMTKSMKMLKKRNNLLLFLLFFIVLISLFQNIGSTNNKSPPSYPPPNGLS